MFQFAPYPGMEEVEAEDDRVRLTIPGDGGGFNVEIDSKLNPDDARALGQDLIEAADDVEE